MLSSPDFIPVAAPSITAREGEMARDAALNAWGADHYAFNEKFETDFATYIGVKHAVSLPHATAALHLILAALGVGDDDEVIVPNVTWIASVAPVSYVGATPVFVDIDPRTWCIDCDQIEQAITPKTRAIIGVDLYGSMCDWPRLEKIAKHYGLHLIEDAAEALGSSIAGKMAGSFGAASAFSFHGSKTMVTGEGGMLATNDSALFERVQSLRDHGRPKGDRFFQNDEIAFKYKMSAMQAAVGSAQLERIEYLVGEKRRIFNSYKDNLSKTNGLQLNYEPENTSNSYWMTTIIPDQKYQLDKFSFQAELKKRNIDSRPFFSELSSLKAYHAMPQSARFLPELRQGAIPAKFGLNLPSGYNMSDEKIALVCDIVKEILVRNAH